jgi:hypothetical protein
MRTAQIERVGETDEFDLVELLAKAGWHPAFVAAEFGRDPAGSHVLTAKKHGREVRAAASTRREAVSIALREISTIERLPVLQPTDLGGEQLTIDEELQSWHEWFSTLPRRGQG